MYKKEPKLIDEELSIKSVFLITDNILVKDDHSIKGMGMGNNLLKKLFSPRELLTLFKEISTPIFFWDERMTKPFIEKCEDEGVYHGLTTKKQYDENRTILYNFGFKNKHLCPVTIYLHFIKNNDFMFDSGKLKEQIEVFERMGEKTIPW